MSAAEDDNSVREFTALTHEAKGGDYDDVPDVTVSAHATEDDAGVFLVKSTLAPEALSSVSVPEGDTVVYWVGLGTAPTGDVTVSITGGANGITISPATLTFTTTNWTAAQTVTVSAAEDDNSDDEMVTLTHSASGGGYDNVDDVDLTATSVDNDARIVVDPASVTVPEGGSGTYTVKLSSEPTGNVTVSITGEANGITVSPDALTFTTTNWSTAQTVTVSAAEDDNADNESATLTHSASGGGYDNAPDVEVTATSQDDDAAGIVVDPASVTVPEGGSETYTVKLSAEPSGDVTVGITGAADGLTVSPDELTFSTTNWSTAQTVTVSAAEDDNMDSETATFTHSASGGGYDNVPDVEVTATSQDNDAAGIVVDPESVTVPEGGSETYTVKLSAEPSGDVTVGITGAADGLAVSPDALEFSTSNWGAAQTVTVSAAEDDNTFNESATLTHSASGGGYDNVPDVDVTARSADNDTSIVASPDSLGVDEGGTASFGVNLSHLPTGDVTVAIEGEAQGITVSPDTLTFTTANWGDWQPVTVSAAEDDNMDSETIKLTLKASGGGYGNVPDVEVTATSEDNDAAGLVLRRNGNPTGGIPVPEGGSNTYTVELTTAPTGTVTVEIAKGPPPPPGDFVSWSPQTLTFEISDWATPQTVTVESAEDDDMISDYVVLVHTASGGGYSATKNLTVQQQDDDIPPHLEVSATELAVEEGSSATYTVKPAYEPLPSHQWGEVVVTIAGGTDAVSASPVQLTFNDSNWRTAQTVTVTAAEDDNDAHETATFTHTSGGGGYDNAPAAVVTVTVEDDDAGDDDEPGGDPLPAPRLPDTPPRSGLDYIELRWPEVPDATHYQARLRPWGSEGWTSWSDPFLTRPNTAFEELPPGLHVEIGVRACRAARASACGKVALVQAATEPHGPGGVMLVARTPVSAVVAWAPNFRNTHAVFEFGHSRDMSAAAPDEVTGRAPPQSGSYTFGGLEAGVRYRFFARAAVLHGGPGIPELPPLSASRWEVAGPPGQGDGARGATVRDGTGVRLRGMGPGPRGEPARRFTSLEGLKETLVDTVVVAGGGGSSWTAAAATVAQPWLALEKREQPGPGGLLVRRRTVDGLEAGVYVTTVFLHMDGRTEPSAMLVDTLVIGRSVTEEEAAAALLGGQALGEVQAGVLDRLGNGDGSYDLGDALSWIARCRRGRAECGGAGVPGASRESPAPVPDASSTVTPPPATTGRASRRVRGRALRTRAGRRNRGSPVRGALPRGRAQGTGRRGSSCSGGSRRVGGARRPRFRRCLGPGLLFAALAGVWGCGDAGQVAEPALPPAEPERPFLTLRLESPGARVDAGVLVTIEGPGIDSLRAAPGYELVASDADADGGRWRVIVAGALVSGPLLELWTPSPGLDGRYRATVAEAAGHDYVRRNPAEYETILAR